VITFLSLVISSTSLKHDVNNWRQVEPVDTPSVVHNSTSGSVDGADFQPTYGNKVLQEIKATESAPPQQQALQHDLDGEGDNSQVTTAVKRSTMARTQKWSKDAPASSDNSRSSEESSESSGGRSLFWPSMILLGVLATVAGVAVKQKGEEQQAKPFHTVSLGVKARAAPAPLPAGITEVDLLETFDSYDKERRGFISRDVLEGLLGPDEIAQGNAFASIGRVDALFYHDFRKLVLQKGPIQNIVANNASRKRGSPIELTACK